MEKEALKRDRRFLIRTIHRTKDYVTDWSKEPLTEEISFRLREVATELQNTKAKFDEVQTKLWQLVDNTNKEKSAKEEDELFKQTDEIRLVVFMILGKIRELENSLLNETSRKSILNTSVSQSSCFSHTEPKLPEIKVPKFYGDIRKFSDFKGLFQNLIHDDPNISKVRKLYYLKEALMDGKATDILTDVELSEDAYLEGWSRLLERYDNRRATTQAHLYDLFSIPKIKDESELRKILNSVDLSLRGLKVCGEPVESWSTVICYLVCSRIDSETKKDWENSITDNSNYPRFSSLRKFLEIRATNIEMRKLEKLQKEKEKPTILKKSFSTSKSQCYVCNGTHLLIDCRHFMSKTPTERFQIIKQNKLCINCFNRNHIAADCHCKGCKVCNGKHHSLLHFKKFQPVMKSKLPTFSRNQGTQQLQTTSSSQPDSSNNASLSCSKLSSERKIVILPTAVVHFTCGNISGNARILLDSCSQPTLVSKSFINRFKLPLSDAAYRVSIKGVSETPVSSESVCSITLQSRFQPFKLEVEADVVPVSSFSYSINHSLIKTVFENIQSVELADNAFTKPNVNIPSIDIIVGAEYYERCIRNKTRRIKDITLRLTHFGWTISGPVYNRTDSNCNFISKLNPAVCFNFTSQIDQQLRKFWEMEEAELIENPNGEHDLCNHIFEETFQKDPQGRFIVRLPFKINKESLSNNRSRALSSLLRIEKSYNPETWKHYVDFMREYVRLGHMERVNPTNAVKGVYYIPHRAVLRPSSTTTKLRVVFNASAKTSTGYSLNDILMVGPSIQSELIDILIRFRAHRIAFSADIEKMYRKVIVHQEDRDVQRILWREDPDKSIEEYQLKTVTYGTAPASFLATKCLSIIARSIADTCPITSNTIRNDFYMDDLLTGADSIENAGLLQKTVHENLKEADFHLRKYMSNSKEFLRKLNSTLIETPEHMEIGQRESVSVLGLLWDPSNDVFLIKINLSSFEENPLVTKRRILSEVARIFDPLGFLSPVTVRAKILLQDLWRESLGWDEIVSARLSEKYRKYYSELNNLSSFCAPRLYSSLSNVVSRQLIGFCDASEVAYCAVIYIRVLNRDEHVEVSLVCAKTRVAPIKSLTIPKLELQAAVLLTDLIKRVSTQLNVDLSNIFTFSDSTVVLSWLSKQPNTWKTFVCNRVKKIIGVLPRSHWSYIDTKSNPADLATRGLSVSSFLENKLWLFGPHILHKLNFCNVSIPTVDIEIEKRKPKSCFSMTTSSSNVWIIDRFSSYSKLINVISYVVRFVNRCKSSSKTNLKSKDPDNRVLLSVEERNVAMKVAIRVVQSAYFTKEVIALSSKSALKKSSSLLSLSPFLDDDSLLRVGGRLRNSNLPFDRRHPVILPAKSCYFENFVRYLHLKYYHANRSFLVAHITSKFWVVGGMNNCIKKIVRSCVICVRFSAQIRNQIMGQLPKERVTISRPFSVVGVDLAGPFSCKCVGHRSIKFNKIYAAFFVCFATKAVHIEILSSLTTESFLLSFKRFISRRGLPSTVWSDNATNFVGARNYLIFNREIISKFCASEGINWRFIPPRAPHQGGLWESAIKSAKYHLVRVIGIQVLTFEEYTTVFSSIEAILNSRPLCRPSSNVTDDVLTPAHFLVGSSLTSLPEPENINSSILLSTRYSLLSAQINSFWKSWRHDYLNQLQSKSKWKVVGRNLEVGDIVIMKDDLLHPALWSIGRVQSKYPGEDGVVRVVDVVSKGSTKRRSISKLLLLVSDDLRSSAGGQMLT